MGNCCCGDDKDAQGVDTESSRLLANPVSSASIQQSYHESYGSQNKIEDEEQGELNRILQDTIAQVINISSLGHHLDNGESNERAKLYHYKVDQVLARTPYQKKAKPCILQEADVSKVLYWPSMSESERANMEAISSQLNQAFMDIQVDSTEALVVDFGSSL